VPLQRHTISYVLRHFQNLISINGPIIHIFSHHSLSSVQDPHPCGGEHLSDGRSRRRTPVTRAARYRQVEDQRREARSLSTHRCQQ